MIIRTRKDKDNPYVIINKKFLNNPELSWQAKGLLSYLLSLPDDWEINVQDLKNRSKNGRDSTNGIIKELINQGYIVKEQPKDSKGKFEKNIYTVLELPFTGNPLTGNPKQISNKYTNTIINNSIEVSEETSKTKKSLSDKKEIKISDKAIDKYKVLIERWNGIGQATSHDINKKTKTLKKIITLFQQLEAGTFFRYTGIDKKWCADNNVPVEWMNKKFTLSEISKGIRHMGQQFKPGFWPYTPEQKKKLLPKSLAESLYNPYGGCASVFLKALANPPKEVEPLPENKYPQIVDRYCEDFLGSTFEQLPISSQRNIIKAVNAIVDWQKRQAGILCPIFSSTSFSTYFGTKDKPNNFISTHINFLKNKGGIYSNKEPYHKSFKPSVSMINPEGGRWQRFISDFSSVHGFDINPDKDKIRKLKIMYNN